MGTLDGKVAVVTGAGQGVGQGIALALAGEGAAVAVLGRTPEKLEATCELVRTRGGVAQPFVANVKDLETVPDVVADIAGTFGGVDILVNNAYTGAFGPLIGLSDWEFQRGFSHGPFAAFAFMRACHPEMKKRGGGAIVNMVTSAMVRWDSTGYGPYAAAKQALRALTRTAAVEWGPDGIRCVSVAPHALSPGVATWAEARPEEAAEFVKTIPLGRMGDCEQDIGRAVVALVGQDLRYLTGATIPLDGGQAYFG